MLRFKEIKLRLEEDISIMNAGDKLPSRPALCKAYDTTRTTLDKAIHELVKEKKLISKDGSGTYVAGSDIPQKAGHWGVIVPDVMESIYSGIVRGVENMAQFYGANIILCNSDSNFEKQAHYIRRLTHSGVDGFIIVPVVSADTRENYKLYSQLTAAKVPFVFCNRSLEGISSPVVTSNDFYGGYIATKHLLDNGYRNIAYISHMKYKTSMDRCQGYISAMIERDVPVNRKIVVLEDKSGLYPTDFHVMTYLLNSGEKVDAVFCFNDIVTTGVYKAILAAGLKISDDIGVIGYDNSDICEKAVPPVTSVAYKNLEIGEKAADVLWKMINKDERPDFEFYLFQPSIIVRESCLGLSRT